MGNAAPLKIKGFTLVELLVVISIIAILSVVGITVFSGVQDNVRNTKVGADFDAIYKNIEQERVFQQKTFGQITGNWCSDCSGCRTATDVSQDATCLSTMTTSYSKVTTAPLPLDPWSNPYVWDENEGEGGVCNYRDAIRSVGPDHLYGTSDDKVYLVPLGVYIGC